ncbi:MAG TPA: helix-turn-helix domain-containing protein [Steroidobacteraceae bacterium]|nr:helix-turn-helix domain-containing protein [Steroidobacteraceae bacterium]
MENPQMSDSAHTSELRSYVPRGTSDLTEIHALRIPVGTNLADVERWLIFATLKKCGGNKTRAAALLGVSLKTLYNRLNAYRAQGVALDEGIPIDNSIEINGLHGELSEVSV